MNDRTLLELAARAAGVEVNAARQAERDAAGYGHIGLWTTETTAWNSLADDGVCARLEAACRLEVKWLTLGVVVDNRLMMEEAFESYDDHGGDKNKARRYASTRAAAQLAQATQEQ